MLKINVSKLTQVVSKPDKIVARCPACEEQGGDNKGNNLVLFPDGKFGCVAFPKAKRHNARILALAGTETNDQFRPVHIPIKPVVHPPSYEIPILGRFGRHFVSAGEKLM